MRMLRNWLCVLAASMGLWATGAIRAAEPAPAPPPKIQMAILLDTSSSMEGLINQARAQLWKVVNEFALAKRDGQRPEFQVALYEYGKSSLAKEGGFLRQIVPLTNDLDRISEELFALKTNGGDEYCGWVIESATNGLAWSESNRDLKLIFIAGNEPFTQGPVEYKRACTAAVAKNIVVNTIHCGSEAEGIRTGWQDGARLADGSFLNIDQNRVVAAIETPFDKKLAELSSEVNGTYIPVGNEKARSEVAARQVEQDRKAAGAAPAVAAERGAFKGSGQYRTASDLVDEVAQGKRAVKDVKDEELPADLRKLALPEREAYVKQKSAERAKIQAEIQKQSESRRAYIVEEERKRAVAAPTDTLDAAIIQAVRTQAEKKQFKFGGEGK